MKIKLAIFIAVIFIAATQVAANAPNADAVAVALAKRNVSDVIRSLDSLSRAGASNVIKARSFRHLGDHQFIIGNYKKAADFYEQATKLDNSSKHRYHYAMALMMDGETSRAAEILRAIAVVSSDSMGGLAALALMQLPSVNQQTVAAFTVQVGAFGSRENAENLVKQLTPQYDNITISQTTSGEQTLYRVRVGSFANRDDAQTFAESLITNAGMSARVVEER